MIEKDLENQITFSKYGDRKNGDQYGDWFTGDWGYVIKVYDDRLVLCHHCEVDGKTWSIKRLKSLDDLQNVFEAITDEKFLLVSSEERALVNEFNEMFDIEDDLEFKVTEERGFTGVTTDSEAFISEEGRAVVWVDEVDGFVYANVKSFRKKK